MKTNSTWRKVIKAEQVIPCRTIKRKDNKRIYDSGDTIFTETKEFKHRIYVYLECGHYREQIPGTRDITYARNLQVMQCKLRAYVMSRVPGICSR